MGGFISENDPNYNFKGINKHFNSYTLRGRFNFAAATYGAVFGIYLLSKAFGGKKKQ